MNYLTLEKTDSSLIVKFQTRTISDQLDVKSTLEELFRKVHLSGQSKVVLDFSNLQLISTGMLGALLKFRSHVVFHGATLVLTELNSELEKVFAQAGLEGLFEFELGNEESELRQFAMLCTA